MRILATCILALQFGTLSALAEPAKSAIPNKTRMVPVELGGIKLGANLDKSPGELKVSLFGHHGNLTTYLNNGKVSRVVFEYDYDDGQYEKVMSDVQAKLTELCGAVPAKEHGGAVCRGPHSVLRLTLGKSPAVVLQSSDPREPGNPGDGFDKFITDLRKALTEYKYKEAAKFFEFPYVDYLSRAYPGNYTSLECKDEKEFISKYSLIFNQKRKKEFMEATPYFYAPHQTYGIYSDPSEFIIRRNQGRWYITEFAYRE